jgi:outer membrane receptor protein involved in Fe transport
MTGCSFSSSHSITILQNFVGNELATLSGGTFTPMVDGACATINTGPDFSPGLIHNSLNQTNVPWRVGLDWTFMPHNLLYFTVSKGFKAGSSPALGASQGSQLTPVTQEELLAYELGVKSELFDRSLVITAAAFHYDYTNKQELGRELDPVYGALQTLLNIPKSREDGEEISVVWRPIEGLSLNVAATHLDSEVTSNFSDFGPYPLGPTDLINFKGEAFPFTPEWSVQWGARYGWALSSDWRAFVAADGSYQGSESAAFGSGVAAVDHFPSLDIPSYSLLNLSAGIETADGHWRGQIWAHNVTDEYYYNSVNYVSDTVVRYTGMPTTIGITLSYRN